MPSSTSVPFDPHKKSIRQCLYSFQEVLPGLLVMLHIAVFSNNLPGVPNPFTLENLFFWLDGVIGPLNHQPFFQILNSNFVWNPILMGFIIGNVFGVPDSWKRGLSYIHMLMPLGIIMLAPHFILGHSFKLGLWPILLCTGFMFLTASATLFLARFFKVDDRQASVIAGGLSTGDPHACVILMPLIKAKGGQVINGSIGVIGFGLMAMVVLPWVSGYLDLPEKMRGLAAVVGVGNGSQALYAAYQSGYEAGRYALWFDVGRHVIMPAGFIYVFIVMFVRKRRDCENPNSMATQGIEKFPLWLGIFIFFWILAALHLFKEPAHQAVFNMVKWDFSLAAAALGLSLSFKDITAAGIRGFILTFAVGAFRLALLLALLAVLVKTGLLAG
ncbi:MAG: putative sulfate exporter family transporter [Deltaproteobacteria bacterium]|nr:putative sulfate exporter family transporter [Deltaproteobacteria bacterium]